MHDHSHSHGSNNRIGWAFFLNVTFTIIEFIGGILTNSTAIMADAVHDLMALDIVAAREGLKTNAETALVAVRVFAYEPDEVVAPAVIVRRPTLVRAINMSSTCWAVSYRVDLVVSPMWDRAADKTISEFMPSIETALRSDVTADGSVASLHVSEFVTDDAIGVGDAEYVGGFWTVEATQS